MVVLDIGIKAGEIEAVGQVIFVDLAKVLVATGRDELSVAIVSIGKPVICKQKERSKHEGNGEGRLHQESPTSFGYISSSSSKWGSKSRS